MPDEESHIIATTDMIPASQNSNQYVFGVIVSYWVVSISMVYLNKVLLSKNSSSIPAPLFVTWIQCIVTCAICYAFGKVGENRRKLGKVSFFDEYPLVSYNPKIGVSVLPLSLVFVAMVTFNNVCLQYVAVSFYNVARSLSIVFNVFFTYLVLGKQTSMLTCLTLGVVILGFYLGIEGEIDFSMVGTAAGVLASIFVSLNSIYTASVLPKVDNDKSMLLFYNNLNAVVLFLPLIGLFESQILVDNVAILCTVNFWLCMIVSGIMGFAIGLVTVMQVKATSPLTHNISGTAKAAAQSMLAFYIWGNEATVKGLFGIALVLLGSGFYTWVQMNAPKK